MIISKKSGTLDEAGEQQVFCGSTLYSHQSFFVSQHGCFVYAAIKKVGAEILPENSGLSHEGWRVETSKKPISSAFFAASLS
jgi:hypothetical protein